MSARKLACKRGHVLEGDNVYIRPDGKGRGCRACRALRYKAAQKAAPRPSLREFLSRSQDFWKGVAIGKPDECWLWQRGLGMRGEYGAFRIGYHTLGTHRVSYVVSNGKLPRELVCHTCDNPLCCNPKHLYDGSSADNARDREERGRIKNRIRGEKSHMAKLTEEEVREIRYRGEAGEIQRDLAREFGVTQVAISHILLRKNWKHVV